MRVFHIQPDNTFTEYVQLPYQVDHEESVLEKWLESNPGAILEDDGILIIGRQVSTNLGGFIDLLGVDRQGNVVVIELKRDRTPRDTIAQSLEYASFIERLDTDELEVILRSYLNDASLSLAEYHRAYFELSGAEAVAFNKDQRIVLIGQRITSGIRQTASFLRSKGIRVTCVEFTFFQADGEGDRILSQETVIGKEFDKFTPSSSGSLPVVTEDSFLASLDDYGRTLFCRIIELARGKSLPIHWGTKGFSLNVEVNGVHIAVCFGYPPDCVYKQSLYTGLYGGVEKKTAVPEQIIQALWKQAEATELFAPAGQELKCQLTRSLTEAEVNSIVRWCESVEQAIHQYGLRR